MADFKTISDKMAEEGWSALDDDSTHAEYLKLNPEEKAIADGMADNGRFYLDDDSVWAQYQKLIAPVAQDSTYTYSNPNEYEDLKRNVAEVGYSGLDENQKALFKSQFPNSKYARSGGSFEDAIKYVDESAGVNEANKNTGNAYTLGRDILTTGLAPIVAGAEYLKDRAFSEGGWQGGEKPYSEYLTNNMEAGNKGEGVTGFLGNPINVAGGAGNLLKGAPVIGNAFTRGAIEGAGLSAADQYAQTGSVDPRAVAISGGAGGLISGLGSAIGNKRAEFADYLKKEKMLREDPFDYFESHPELSDELHAWYAARNQADPAGLYDMWEGYGHEPSMTKDILKAAKQDILSRSSLPRKMSTISDNEARAHLDEIIKNIRGVKMKNIKINPENPLKDVHSRLVNMGVGAIGGHYLFGLPGALAGAGAGLSFPKVGKVLDKGLSKGIDVAGKASLTPAGELASQLPYSALTANLVDTLAKTKQYQSLAK